MSSPCSDACPFAGCPSCEYQGGATVSVTYGVQSETIEGPLNEATPAGNGGLTNGLARSHDG